MNPSFPAGAAAVELPLGAALALLRTRLDGFAGAAVPVESPSRGQVSSEDWDLLFDAIRARLVLAVAEPASCPSSETAVASIRSAVLECVDALALLHAMRPGGHGHPA